MIAYLEGRLQGKYQVPIGKLGWIYVWIIPHHLVNIDTSTKEAFLTHTTPNIGLI